MNVLVCGKCLVYCCRYATFHIGSIFDDFYAAPSKQNDLNLNFIDCNQLSCYCCWYRNLVNLKCNLWVDRRVNFIYNYKLFVWLIYICSNSETTLYFQTHNRFPAWLIGLNFGYFLHVHRSRKFRLPKV